MLHKLADISISVPTILDLSGMVGQELHEHLQQQAAAHQEGTLQPAHAEPPRVATVAPDGGRIMTRAVGGRGVHDQAWKETKNACLLTMSSSPTEKDPHPELPACFGNRQYVEQLVRELHPGAGGRSSAPGEASAAVVEEVREAQAEAESQRPAAASSRKKPDWRPKRLVRTCVCSLVSSQEFGPLVAGEAQRRGFYQASQRAFLGDGQAWNWTLHADYFPDFVPITDYVHPLAYVYQASRAMAPDDCWPVCLRAATACWQGRVADFLQELRAWQAAHPLPPDEEVSDQDPRCLVAQTVTYLENNQHRMDYPTYRKAGLPVSTAMIESLIKEVNYRVKGTEKFWNRPQGAEQILQVRAAALCDDDRLSQWILNRPGSYFYRPTSAKDHAPQTAA